MDTKKAVINILAFFIGLVFMGGTIFLLSHDSLKTLQDNKDNTVLTVKITDPQCEALAENKIQEKKCFESHVLFKNGTYTNSDIVVTETSMDAILTAYEKTNFAALISPTVSDACTQQSEQKQLVSITFEGDDPTEYFPCSFTNIDQFELFGLLQSKLNLPQ